MRLILAEMRARSSMAVLAALLAAIAVACGGDDEDGGVVIGTVAPTASETAGTALPTRTATGTAAASATATSMATATATATVAASPCPIAPETCSFISQVAQNVIEGDSDAVMSLSKATIYTCPGPNGEPGGPFPLCNGAPTGELRLGFAMRRIGGESGAVVEAEVERLVAEWMARTEPGLSDEYGGGEARAFTVACPGFAPDERRECRDRFSLVFSGLSPGASAGEALRTVLAVEVRRDRDEYRAVGFTTGVLDAGLELALRGGSAAAGSAAVPSVLVGGPEDWSVVTFLPWAPIGLTR